VIIDLDLTGGHLVQALVDDSEGLTELFDSAQVSIVTISVLSNGDIELDLIVGIVRGDLADDGRNDE